MSFVVVSYLEDSQITDLNQFADALNGKAACGQPIVLTALNDAANYALKVRNLEAGSCKVLQLQDHADVEILGVDGDQIRIGWPLVLGSGVYVQKHAKIIARQGGSATSWNTPGVTTYTPTNIVEQRGVADGGKDAAAKSGTITFPSAFAYAPHVSVSIHSAGTTTVIITIQGINATTFTYTWETRDGSITGTTVAIHWVAVGPPA